MPFARSNREMLTPGLSTGGLQSVRSAAFRLGGLGHPVPHDRVGDLQPLSRQRFERLAVRHAPFSAPGVVVAPSSLCPGKVVAREYEQVLQPFVALARCRHRGDLGPRPAVARRQAAVRRAPVVA